MPVLSFSEKEKTCILHYGSSIKDDLKKGKNVFSKKIIDRDITRLENFEQNEKKFDDIYGRIWSFRIDDRLRELQVAKKISTITAPSTFTK